MKFHAGDVVRVCLREKDRDGSIPEHGIGVVNDTGFVGSNNVDGYDIDIRVRHYPRNKLWIYWEDELTLIKRGGEQDGKRQSDM